MCFLGALRDREATATEMTANDGEGSAGSVTGQGSREMCVCTCANAFVRACMFMHVNTGVCVGTCTHALEYVLSVCQPFCCCDKTCEKHILRKERFIMGHV